MLNINACKSLLFIFVWLFVTVRSVRFGLGTRSTLCSLKILSIFNLEFYLCCQLLQEGTSRGWLVEMWLFRREIFPLSLSFRIYFFSAVFFQSTFRCLLRAVQICNIVFFGSFMSFRLTNDGYERVQKRFVMNIILIQLALIGNGR